MDSIAMQNLASAWNGGDTPNPGEIPRAADENTSPHLQPPSNPLSSDHARRPIPPPETNAGEPKHYRKCRICLESVPPTYENTGVLGGIRNRRPRRQYISEEEGRLISPCLCKGSIKYIHEGCLMYWIQGNPSRRFQCDICKYQYRVERLSWAQRLRSPLVSLLMTLTIVFITIFLLGFVADPILALWADPVGTIADSVAGGRFPEDIGNLGQADGWFEHLLKGIFSLGLLGFLKAFLVMSPWQWWNLRTSGLASGGARRAGTGRQRMENINTTLVLIGVLTFLYTVWKGTRKYTARTLDRASQRILNVQSDEESDDEDDEDGHT